MPVTIEMKYYPGRELFTAGQDEAVTIWSRATSRRGYPVAVIFGWTANNAVKDEKRGVLITSQRFDSSDRNVVGSLPTRAEYSASVLSIAH